MVVFTSKDARKVVVRLLPPEIDEEDLISTFPPAPKYTWRRFHPGKRVKGEAKASINARCYLSFSNQADGDSFISKYHGHSFVDEKGETFRAVCCYAPYQKLPQKPVRDKTSGTLESDGSYAKWLTKKDAPKEEKVEEESEEKEKIDENLTPLVEHIRNQSQKKRRDRKKLKTDSFSSSWWTETTLTNKRSKCDSCGSKRRLGEDEEGGIYCQRCWEDYEWTDDVIEEGDEESEAHLLNDCPKKHGLNKFPVPEEKIRGKIIPWWCSHCKAVVTAGEFMYGCRKCDYDLCSKCYGSKIDPSYKSNRRKEEREKREKRRQEKKERKQKKEQRREYETEKTWVAKEKDKKEEEYDDNDWYERERERKKQKKRRREEEKARYAEYYDDGYYKSRRRPRCDSCGTKRRLCDRTDEGLFCEKCWSKWNGGEVWVKK